MASWLIDGKGDGAGNARGAKNTTIAGNVIGFASGAGPVAWFISPRDRRFRHRPLS
jgi:hypothetical protein